MEEKYILLIEDNPDDIDLTLRAFQKNNIHNKIAVARDGVEAVDFIFCYGKYKNRDIKINPALILLDLKIPKIDGIEVLRRIRSDEQTKLIPVVILSTSKEKQDIINCYTLGANSYIRKPVNFEHFFEMIRQLGQYWLNLNEIPMTERNY